MQTYRTRPKESAFMFTLFGPRRRFCDGVSRRSFLTIGSLAMGGIGLPTLLRAEEQTGKRHSHSPRRSAW